MKAIVYERYGGPEVLQLREIDKPQPKENEILIRVVAAALNPLDWHYMRGEPYLVRMSAGWSRPKSPRLGADLAGVVEAVGSQVTLFEAGEEVYGSRMGAFGEYVVTQGLGMAPKPANLSFEQAAAFPVAAITALQGLRDQGQVQPGQRVLVNGAAGGVGTFAVQIAHALGAEVTAVCSTRNLELAASLGAAHVIDYTREDFTAGTQRYDVILDIVGTHGLRETLRALTPAGRLVIAGGLNHGRLLGPMTDIARAALLARFVPQKLLSFLADAKRQDLLVLKELVEAGKLRPVIERTYTLEQVPEAMAHLEQGHVAGKLVVRI